MSRARMRSGRWAVPLARAALVEVLAFAAAQAPAGAGDPTLRFEDVSATKGIGPYAMAEGMGGGVATADFDEDGFIDFFVPNAEGERHQLWRNLHGERFEDVAVAAGVGMTEGGRCALWLDDDGDGDLDLLVANDTLDAETSFRLFRQASPAGFVDATREAGLFRYARPTREGRGHRGGMCAGDIDRDGWLDVYAGMVDGEPSLFHNRGDGTFEDLSKSSGVTTGPEAWEHQAVMSDFNDDGWPDIYVAVDMASNRLWINRHDLTFTDMAPESGSDSAWNEMGIALGDVDGDGDLDIYVTNIARDGRYNILLRNDSIGGDLRFGEIAREAGVGFTDWGWGCTFLDADGDGRLDLAVTNGWYGEFSNDPSRLFLNAGENSVRFRDASAAAGFDDTRWGSSLVAFDFDRDGDADLLQTCKEGLHLLANQLRRPGGQEGGGSYLTVRPRMAGPNTRAVGAIVRIEAGASRQMRQIGAGTSYLGQEPAEAVFGLGSATRVDRVTVEFPDGRRAELRDVAANQVLDVFPAKLTFLRGDANSDGRVELGDAIAILGYLFLGEEDLACRPAGDANDDGSLDTSDAIYLLSYLFRGVASQKLGSGACAVDSNGQDAGCEPPRTCF